jgi:hypothetical protein
MLHDLIPPLTPQKSFVTNVAYYNAHDETVKTSEPDPSVFCSDIAIDTYKSMAHTNIIDVPM